MKKMIFAIAMVTVFASCGSASSEAVTDSTAVDTEVVIDSAVTADTTAVVTDSVSAQ